MSNHWPLVIIYTDGACSGNPGPGGWGALLDFGETRRELMGSAHDTTNNRMELMAAIEALASLKEPSRVELTTDSRYLKNGMETWLKGWKKRHWRTSSGSSVKNRDLWERLEGLVAGHQVRWHWVAGHSGCPQNEYVDALARQALVEHL